MREAIQQPLNMTRVISFGFLTALLSLFQPIPIVSAQQLTGHVTHETGGTDTQGRRIENLAPSILYPTKSLEKQDAQTLTRKPHRLIRKSQNAPVASVEPSPRQLRRSMDTTGLEHLAVSISERGVLQPIRVRRKGARFELIARQAFFELMNPKASTESLPEAKDAKGSAGGSSVVSPK